MGIVFDGREFESNDAFYDWAFKMGQSAQRSDRKCDFCGRKANENNTHNPVHQIKVINLSMGDFRLKRSEHALICQHCANKFMKEAMDLLHARFSENPRLDRKSVV